MTGDVSDSRQDMLTAQFARTQEARANFCREMSTTLAKAGYKAEAECLARGVAFHNPNPKAVALVNAALARNYTLRSVGLALRPVQLPESPNSVGEILT